MYAVRAERNGRRHPSHEILVAGYGSKGIEVHKFDEFWLGPLLTKGKA